MCVRRRLLSTFRAFLSDLARRGEVILAGRPLSQLVPLLQRECECFTRIPAADREKVRATPLHCSSASLSLV